MQRYVIQTILPNNSIRKHRVLTFVMQNGCKNTYFMGWRDKNHL